MTELRPLFESSENPRTRALLRAGRGERPPTRALERTTAALGVGFALTTTSASATALGGTAVSAAGGGSAVGALTLVKWLAVGALSGTIVAGSASLVQRGLAGEAASPAPAGVREAPRTGPALGADGRETPRRDAKAPVGAASGTAANGDVLHATQRSPKLDPLPAALPTASTRGVPEPNGQLSLELAFVDRARGALARGAAEQALRELAAYHTMRQTGTLDREAWILRIDALLLVGQRGEAEELARGYLERFPRDAHATRLRALASGEAKK